MEYWLAYSVRFLTSDFFNQSYEDRIEEVFQFNLNNFSDRVSLLTEAVDAAKFPKEPDRLWGRAIAALTRINLYRTDLQHGMWESDELGGVGVQRRRRGEDEELTFHHWPVERLEIFTKVILWTRQILLSLLGSETAHNFRASQRWVPDKPAEDSLMILWAKTDSEYLWEQLDKLDSEEFLK